MKDGPVEVLPCAGAGRADLWPTLFLAVVNPIPSIRPVSSPTAYDRAQPDQKKVRLFVVLFGVAKFKPNVFFLLFLFFADPQLGLPDQKTVVA